MFFSRAGRPANTSNRLSAAARARAVTRHSWDATFEALADVYAELVSGRGPAPIALTA